jgi:hypothetical protein
MPVWISSKISSRSVLARTGPVIPAGTRIQEDEPRLHPAAVHRGWRRFSADQGFQGLQVAEGGMDVNPSATAQILVELRLAGGGHGGQGPAVKGTGEGDDLVSSFTAGDAGQFDRRLVGLGTAVGQEDLVGKRVLDSNSASSVCGRVIV